MVVWPLAKANLDPATPTYLAHQNPAVHNKTRIKKWELYLQASLPLPPPPSLPLIRVGQGRCYCYGGMSSVNAQRFEGWGVGCKTLHSSVSQRGHISARRYTTGHVCSILTMCNKVKRQMRGTFYDPPPPSPFFYSLLWVYKSCLCMYWPFDISFSLERGDIL